MIATLKKSFLVDTNTLVYSLDINSQFSGPAAAFFEWSERSERELAVAHQNVIELVNVLVTDYSIVQSEAIEKVKILIEEKPFRLIFPLPTTIERFYKIAKRQIRKPFDLYLAATALDNGIDCIVTNDPKGFKGIEGLDVLSLIEVSKFVKTNA